MKELTIEATPENVDKAIEFVDEMLEEYGCGMKEQMAIDVAVDELFANIAHYAYNPETGYATVKVDVIKDPLSVEITFVDYTDVLTIPKFLESRHLSAVSPKTSG